MAGYRLDPPEPRDYGYSPECPKCGDNGDSHIVCNVKTDPNSSGRVSDEVIQEVEWECDNCHHCWWNEYIPD